MLALRRWRCTPLPTPVCSRRSAHAATAPREDENSNQNQAGPSNYYRRSDPDSGPGSGKGKSTSTSTSTSRDRNEGAGTGGGAGSDQKEYRFPVKGKAGGDPDPFEVMALDRTASPSEVKKQYYRLALLLHPDSSHPSSSPEHFASLHRAYTLLSSPAKRSSYVQTGYGWDSTGKEGGGRGRSSHSYEDQMRAEIRYRAQGGTSGWHGRGRPTYGGHGHGFRESDAGRGAWGGFRGGDGKWEAYDTGEFSTSQGTGEERYMSNTQFLGLIAGISIALGWAQYHRFIIAKDQGSELLSKQHLDASHALAEARQEAAMFGKERRERIRRRVRESEVLKEVEQLELKGIE